MTCSAAERRAEALLQLERSRTGWLARCAHAQQATAEPPSAADEAFGQGSGLNAIVSEWLAAEVAARLWPEHPTGAAEPTGADGMSNSAPRALLDLSDRHPWLCVLAALLAGGVAASQRHRLLRWGISTALPWLSTQACVIALPLFAQWLARQPGSEPTPAQATPSSPAPEAPAEPHAHAGVQRDVNAPSSAAAGSPG